MSNPTSPNLTDLEAKRAVLALARAQHEARQAELKAARAAFESQHAALIEMTDTLAEVVDEADKALREEALAVYAADPTATVPGIEIKQWDTMEFDPTEALTWARVNMPGLLVLDAAAYKKLLKEVTGSKTLAAIITMPGTVKQEPKVSVARDLSAYLPSIEDRWERKVAADEAAALESLDDSGASALAGGAM